jgi:hypothetical protein
VVVVVVDLSPVRCLYPSFYVHRGGGGGEITRKVTELVTT